MGVKVRQRGGVRESGAGGGHCDKTVALSSCHSSQCKAGAVLYTKLKELMKLGRGGEAGKPKV